MPKRKGGAKKQQSGKKRRKGKSWKDIEYEGGEEEAATAVEPRKRGHRPTQKRAAATRTAIERRAERAWEPKVLKSLKRAKGECVRMRAQHTERLDDECDDDFKDDEDEEEDE